MGGGEVGAPVRTDLVNHHTKDLDKRVDRDREAVERDLRRSSPMRSQGD